MGLEKADWVAARLNGACRFRMDVGEIGPPRPAVNA